MADTPFSEEEIVGLDLTLDLENKTPKELLETQERKRRILQKKETLKKQMEELVERYLKEKELLRMTSQLNEKDSSLSWEDIDEELGNPKSGNHSEF